MQVSTVRDYKGELTCDRCGSGAWLQDVAGDAFTDARGDAAERSDLLAGYEVLRTLRALGSEQRSELAQAMDSVRPCDAWNEYTAAVASFFKRNAVRK